MVKGLIVKAGFYVLCFFRKNRGFVNSLNKNQPTADA